MSASTRNVAAAAHRRQRLPELVAGLACLAVPVQVFAGPFTFTKEAVSQSTQTHIVVTGPVFDVYSVTWTDAAGLSHTSSVTSGSALFKPHITISPKKGTTVTVKNVSELAIPAQTFVASLFTPPSDVVNTTLVIQPGSFASVGGNTFSLGGTFSTIANAVDYAPASPTYGQLSGVIPTSGFDVHGSSPAGDLQLTLNSPQPWNLNLANAWGQDVPPQGVGVPFSQPIDATLFFNSTPMALSGNFAGAVTFFPDNSETICGQLQFGAVTGNLCASGLSVMAPVPEPGGPLLMLGGLGLMGVLVQRRKDRHAG